MLHFTTSMDVGWWKFQSKCHCYSKITMYVSMCIFFPFKIWFIVISSFLWYIKNLEIIFAHFFLHLNVECLILILFFRRSLIHCTSSMENKKNKIVVDTISCLSLLISLPFLSCVLLVFQVKPWIKCQGWNCFMPDICKYRIFFYWKNRLQMLSFNKCRVMPKFC